MTKKQPATGSDSNVIEIEIAWEAVLTKDGWHLSPTTGPDRGAGMAVKVGAAEAVPHAELLEMIRRANVTDAEPVIRLIVTTDGE